MSRVASAFRTLTALLSRQPLPSLAQGSRYASADEFELMAIVDDSAQFKHRHTRNYVYVQADGTLKIPRLEQPFLRGYFDVPPASEAPALVKPATAGVLAMIGNHDAPEGWIEIQRDDDAAPDLTDEDAARRVSACACIYSPSLGLLAPLEDKQACDRLYADTTGRLSPDTWFRSEDTRLIVVIPESDAVAAGLVPAVPASPQEKP